MKINCWPNGQRRFWRSVKSPLNRSKQVYWWPPRDVWSWSWWSCMLSVQVWTRSNVAAIGPRENSEARVALGLTLRATGNEAAARHNFYSSYCLSCHNSQKEKCSNWNPLYPCTQGHFWSGTVPHFLRSWGGCEWSDKNQVCVGEASIHFQLELNTLHFSSVPTVRNLKDWSRANAEAVP